MLGQIVQNRVRNEESNGLAFPKSIPNVRRGDVDARGRQHIRPQATGSLLPQSSLQIDPRKFAAVGSLRRHDPTDVAKLPGAVPSGELGERIGADQPEQLGVWFSGAKVVHCVEGIAIPAPRKVEFAELKAGFAPDRAAHHFGAMRRRPKVESRLVRGVRGGKKDHPIQMESFHDRPGDDEVPVVNRVETAAEKSDPAGHAGSLTLTKPC